MDAGSQRRLLALRPGQTLCADVDGCGLRLRGRQCRGAVTQPVVAVKLDQEADRGAQVEPRLWPRQHFVRSFVESRGPRLSPSVPRRGFAVRREPVPIRASFRTRPLALERPLAGRNAWTHDFS